MFAELGEQLDDWLHVQSLRHIRLLRRLGLYPKPTPEQQAAAEAWTQATETISRLSPLIGMGLERQEWLSRPTESLTVNFPKYGALRTEAELLKDAQK